MKIKFGKSMNTTIALPFSFFIREGFSFDTLGVKKYYNFMFLCWFLQISVDKKEGKE